MRLEGVLAVVGYLMVVSGASLLGLGLGLGPAGSAGVALVVGGSLLLAAALARVRAV
jgi:hypothetical protein